MAARTVVFIHGNPETSAIWTPLVAALTSKGVADIVTLSPPGFGAPAPDDFDPTMSNYADWLVGELGALRIGGNELDVVGHDWGAGHLYGALDRRPDLLRTWAGDIAGVLHRDYVWHDMAQAWQTPEIGEQAVAGMVDSTVEDKAALFQSLGFPTDMAAEVAPWLNEDMARAVLRLYRTGAQPAVGDLGARLVTADLPPGLVIDAHLDVYVPPELTRDIAAQLQVPTLPLEDRGHWWMVEDVGGIADSLIDFWSAH